MQQDVLGGMGIANWRTAREGGKVVPAMLERRFRLQAHRTGVCREVPRAVAAMRHSEPWS